MTRFKTTLLTIGLGFLTFNVCASESDEETVRDSSIEIRVFRTLTSNKPKELDKLLKQRANLEEEQDGKTPLETALSLFQRKATEKLLPLSDLTRKNAQKETYLHLLIKVDYFDLALQYYNDLRACRRAKDQQGNLPLHLLASKLTEHTRGQRDTSKIFELLRKLHKDGVDLEAENESGISVLALLEEAQQAVNDHRMRILGWTPLHVALKGEDITFRGENISAMEEAVRTFPGYLNTPNNKKTTPFLMLAYKYRKCIIMERPKDAELILRLIGFAREKNGDEILQNDSGDSVRSVMQCTQEIISGKRKL